MVVPSQLSKHIEYLRSQGYEIVVKESAQEIGIVIKNYPLSTAIWSTDKADLLVITHPSYPNPKMDMFLVDPAITLKNGTVPKATSSATKFGKTWQQFSWHVNKWNPAKDNLVTYLDVVNDRLKRNE